MIGEGEYNLNAVKEMKVTDSFSTLDLNVRNCQNTNDYEECTTKAYHDSFMEKCHCIPFNINSKEVIFNKGINEQWT